MIINLAAFFDHFIQNVCTHLMLHNFLHQKLPKQSLIKTNNKTFDRIKLLSTTLKSLENRQGLYLNEFLLLCDMGMK